MEHVHSIQDAFESASNSRQFNFLTRTASGSCAVTRILILTIYSFAFSLFWNVVAPECIGAADPEKQVLPAAVSESPPLPIQSGTVPEKKTSRFSRPATDSKTGSVPLLSAPTVESGEQSLQNQSPRSSEKVAADAIQKQTPPSASATLSPDVSREEPTVSVLTSSQTVPVNPLDTPQEQVSDLEESPYPAEPTLSAEDSDSLIAPEFKPDIKNSSTLAPLDKPLVNATPGSGWLGLVVDERIVTGRLTVVETVLGSPAAGSDLLASDTLLAINGTPLKVADELAAALAGLTPGKEVSLSIERNGNVREIRLLAAERPIRSTLSTKSAPPRILDPVTVAKANTFSPAQRSAVNSLPTPVQESDSLTHSIREDESAVPARPGRIALGVRTLPVDQSTQNRFGLDKAAGAFVVGVIHNMPASKAGVPPGSVIIAVGEQPIHSPQQLTRVVTSGPIGVPVVLEYVLPGGSNHRTNVILEPIEKLFETAIFENSSPVGVPKITQLPRFNSPELAPEVQQTERQISGVNPPPDSYEELLQEVRRLRAAVESLEQTLGVTIGGR